ncbi:alpha-rhamnosidase [Lacihabitans sp. CCS-44]|uniref:alpha-L-rhamnosidase-related protein n=1 Tax=Lacihabitans sp. CCS-44 TaxID=2487331 RepID=UPI0020CEFEB6|nr:alpha-L-rhamnosidase C-terminal domain-containing protein [Lacihabitans sp. CCS-44]MCP9757199.1 alpha-rhamnosidase [Lacihabitans sp. CCS-44]
MRTKFTIAVSILVLFSFLVKAQFGPPTGEPDVINKRWHAQWISVPNASPDGYGVYLFRKSFDLPTKPTNYIIHVSGDNRYKLYVNEKLVSMGPARGDIAHWNYETVDIASYLIAGKNIVAAQVWNEGEFKPEAQITFKTGFVLQGNTSAQKDINTNNTWLCEKDNSFAPLVFRTRGYYVAGAGEIRNMGLSPKNWQSADFDDKNWQKARPAGGAVPKNVLGAFGTMSGWMLVPSIIPQMELKDERLMKVVSVEGISSISNDFPAKKTDLVIPANAKVNIILDQSYLTNAYPNIAFSSGKSANISLRYAEALFAKAGGKGNRNETAEKTFIGRADSLISDGSQNQKFTSLTYRTYRYLQLTISTQNEPLTINDIYGTFTGYPFQMNAQLNTGRQEMDKMLEIGWRTARLCAYETYMDCPYYEQLQYIGDGRIQALVSLYNSGDDRLVKNAINLMDFSRTPEGVTFSRHPSYTPQYIPTFSLWYIGMLQDYARYGADTEFVKSKIGGTRQILDYFKSYQQADGRLKNTPQWMFTDWVDNQKEWRAGAGPMSANGTSAVLDFQLLWAYQVAADLETKLGNHAFANQYLQAAEVLKKTIRAKYWDTTKKLFADREEKDEFSQHTNSLAILTGIVTNVEADEISNQLITNNKLAPASIYFKYYLHQALIKAGKGNDYLKWLDKWRENIQQGLTTWAETSDVDKTRSDCHAWGSSPNIEFYRTILGIDSDGLAFSKVKIEPHLGQMTDISGTMPHPKGSISASYKLENGKWKIQVELPKSITGNLVWKGKKIALKEGINQFNI